MKPVPRNNLDAPGPVVEVVDRGDRPMARMDLPAVHAQNLYHRTVCVVIHDAQGRIFLQKRGKNKRLYAGKWDISLKTHVSAGESRLDAALRGLADELNIKSERLKKMTEIPAGTETGNEFVTLYSMVRPTPMPPVNKDEVAEGYFYTMEELARLIKDFRELLTPGLVRMWETRLIGPESEF